MRPIDADALKKDIEENAIELDGVLVIEVPCAKVLIDNTPTFNPYRPISEETFYKITDAEFEVHDSFWVETPKGKKIEFEKKRPKGEWGPCYENYKNGMFYRDCSVCGKATITGDFIFCPYCGADMRGGTEDG